MIDTAVKTIATASEWRPSLHNPTTDQLSHISKRTQPGVTREGLV